MICLVIKMDTEDPVSTRSNNKSKCTHVHMKEVQLNVALSNRVIFCEYRHEICKALSLTNMLTELELHQI